jgi:hypothetical protein
MSRGLNVRFAAIFSLKLAEVQEQGGKIVQNLSRCLTGKRVVGIGLTEPDGSL